MADVLSSPQAALVFLRGGSHVATKDQEQMLWSRLCELVGTSGKQLKSILADMPELSEDGMRLLLSKATNSLECSLGVLDIRPAELNTDDENLSAASYVLPTKRVQDLRQRVLKSAQKISQSKL